jgi:hypothetical protein
MNAQENKLQKEIAKTILNLHIRRIKRVGEFHINIYPIDESKLSRMYAYITTTYPKVPCRLGNGCIRVTLYASNYMNNSPM